MAGGKGIEVAQAYVTIIPSMKDSQKTIARELNADAVGNEAGKDIGDGIQRGLSVKDIAIGQVLGNIITSAASKAADAAKQLIGDAFSGAGTYEQLAGGMEKLFGDSAQTVIDNAQGAYLTAGKSANEYMEQVTGFAATLVKSTGGDTEEAARLADMAIRDMSDNVNTFGTDADSVQNAIQGIAKGNYSMLDNLSLGFAGSQQGMVDLINASGVLDHTLTDTGELADVSFGTMLEAIHAVQEQTGITDTTVNEAMGTLEGSANATKSAWENVLTAIGTGDSKQLDKAIDGLVDSLFGTINKKTGEREGGLLSNVIRIGGNVMKSLADKLPSLVGKALENLPKVISDIADKLLKSDNPFIKGFTSAFQAPELGSALDGIKGVFEAVVTFFTENGETIGTIVGTIATAIGKVVEVVSQVFDVVAPLIPMIAGAFAALEGFTVISSIVSAVSGFIGVVGPALGMIQSIPGLVAVITTALGGPIPIIIAIVGAIVGFIATNEDARKVVLDVWNAIKDGVTKAIEFLKKFIPETWDNIKNTVKTTVDTIRTTVVTTWDNIKTTVTTTIDSIKTGVTEKWNAIKETVADTVENIRNAISEKFEAAKEKAFGIFDGIKDGIKEKIEWAYNKVKGIIDDIKGLFNFEWSLPQPKLPHITWGWDDVGGIVSVPTFGIDWYATGGFVQGAQLVGVGERGGEFIWPSYEPYLDRYADALAERIGGGGVTVTGNTFIVRRESDIRAISYEINRQAERERESTL